MNDFVVKNGVSIGGSLKKAEGTVTGSATLDLSTGNYFDYTPTEDTTFVFSNPPAAGKAHGFKLELTGVLIDNAYDLANAEPPVYGKFSVAAQEIVPTSVFFKPDGTKMYVLGDSGNDVNEYDLSTPWEVYTASYVQNFSVSAQATAPSGMFFKPDGLEMYIAEYGTDAIYSYSLSSAWDISTASYVQNFSVATEESRPEGVFFKPDGTKMYIIGYGGDEVNEYDLSSAWDISTASYLQNFSVVAQQPNPTDLFFKPDGTKMYVIGAQVDNVSEYSLSSAWDVSTASYVQNFSVAAQDSQPNSVFFKDDGLRMYIVGSSADAVYSYTLTSAWDISTASFDLPTEGYFSVTGEEASPSGVFFKTDGTKMYIVGSVGDDINEYTLSTAWDITTASYVQNFSVASQDTQPAGLFFKPDGTKMYMVGEGNSNLHEYTLSTAWDISTASFAQSFTSSTQDGAMNGVFFKPDGLQFYLSGRGADQIYSYSLTTAWDISTASYSSAFYVGTQEINPQDLFFKPDGLSLYVVGEAGDDVNEYSLGTAWSISTASFVRSFSVASEEAAPRGIFFGDNGTKMYITGVNSDAVWAYTTGTYGDATFTYPASVKWPGGTAPSAPADGETDILEFYTDDAGTTYYGIQRGDDMS